MRRMYLYRTGDMDGDTEPLAKAMVEYTALLGKLHGDNFELGTIIQPEGAAMDVVPGITAGMYVYTDTPVPGLEPTLTWSPGP